MTAWFLDTEFDEDGRTIELISIGLVSDDPAEKLYYAISSEFDPNHCNDWVKQNVLPKLTGPRVPRAEIMLDVLTLIESSKFNSRSPLAFWGYFADYDWVVFCQLFGKMVDLPDGFPMYCNDLRQLMTEYGIHKDQLPKQSKSSEHNALADARWTKEAYLWCRSTINAKAAR